MSNAHRIAKELNNTSYDYGGLEETIGFIFDNYYDALIVYRAIIKSQKESDQKRDDAYAQLQKLRADEDRWKKRNWHPQDFDAEEHQRRKEYFSHLMEKDYPIMFDGEELPLNKLTNLIKENMWFFYQLERVDRRVRKYLGIASGPVSKIALWPIKKAVRYTMLNTNSMDMRKKLKTVTTKLDETPDMLKDMITNP